MSAKAPVNDEKTSLNLILEDLRYLFNKEEIDSSELNTVLNNLKSDEAKTYIYNLFAGSKPETALRESFFTSDGALAKFLFGYAKSSPEVVENGFVDYLIKDEFGHTVVLELKSLFDSQKEKDKAGAIKVKKLKQQVLDWLKHKEQIKSYITKGDYVILTNLNEWFFFSRSLNPIDPEPFFTTSLHEFIVEYENFGKNFKEFCDRKEYQSVRYDLDKEFLRSLDLWVKKLSVVKFKVDEKRKLELIIGLINKFIFIQTLDDYGVIGFKWIQNNWKYYENQWAPKGKAVILEEFLSAVDKWFFKYYDTELFRENILEYIENNKENMEVFYENLRDVLGVTYYQGFKGIIQYNFRLIDEDVLGKAYETFLAEVRKEEGVYYTPKHITQYIAENTVGKIFDETLTKIKESIENEDYEKAKELVERFISIRVLDPACGSGSFLIKAIRIIVKKYKELIQLVGDCVKKYSNYAGTLDLPHENYRKLDLLHKIKEIIGPENDRELIAKILIRHIHGVDLDKRALEVAKVNIWLEAIKLAPKEFRYDKLPPHTNYILPSLEMNLCNGDSIIGLPEEETIKFLNDKHKADINKLFYTKRSYLENLMEPKFVEEIEKIKSIIRKELDEEFKKYLNINAIPVQIVNETKPFHWALEFWDVFFDESGMPLPRNQQGFDIIIGNPPYVFTRGRHFAEIEKEFYWVRYFYEYHAKLKLDKKKQSGKINTYSLFIIRGIELLKDKKLLGFIVQNNLLRSTNLDITRKFLLNNCSIVEIDDLGPGVFEGVTAATVNLFLCKESEEQNRNENRIKVVNFRTEPKEVYFVSQKSFLNNISYVFSIYAEENVSEIFEKMRGSSVNLGNICKEIIEGIVTPKGKHNFIVTEQLSDSYKPFIEGKDVRKYYIDYKGKYILYDRKKLHRARPAFVFTNKEKIVVRRIGGGDEAIIAAYDNKQFFTFASINNILLREDSGYNTKYVTAVLNSKLMSCYYLLNFSNKSELTVNVSKTFLETLPIFRATDEQQIAIAKLVDRIMLLHEIFHETRRLWREWSTKLKNSEKSLQDILIEDARLFRRGEMDKVWTTKTTFYPNTSEKRASEEFDKFTIYGDCEKLTLRIYGRKEGKKDELLYEMEFNNKDLMTHIYIALLETLEKFEIKTLSQLFAKTIVPLIADVEKRSHVLTANITKKVIDDLEKRLKEDGIEHVEPHIEKVDSDIKALEAEIDAQIFKLYGLKEDEVMAILSCLKVPTINQEMIMSFFRKMGDGI